MIALIPLILRTLISVNLRLELLGLGGWEATLVEESLIRRLIASIKCGVCGQCYQVDNVRILGHRQDLWYLRALCSSCRTQALVAAVIREDRLPEVITDLTEMELGKFKDTGVLTGDDVLDMHNFLKDFSGDFPQLFNQE